MVVPVQCPSCGKTYNVDESRIGKTGRCGQCSTQFFVTAGDTGAGTGTGTVAASPAPTAAGGDVIDGRYEVLAELGRGSFGVALRARDRKLGRDVAVKMLLPEALNSADAVARFQQECKVLAELGHPNIVPLFDSGRHGESYYLVCKFVKGQTLSAIPPGGFNDLRVPVQYAITLARTLHAVWTGHRILHRDVKPANMMIEEGHLYLMDFGMAACHDKDPLAGQADAAGQQTVAGTIIGTPAYMPPEQACYNRAQIGPWSDLYSVGAVLYHFLTGKLPLPWKGTTWDIMQTVPPLPSHHRKELPKALDAIIMKTLAKRPQDRYQTGQELAEALQRLLDGPKPAPQPIPAPVPVPKPAAVPAAAREPLPLPVPKPGAALPGKPQAGVDSVRGQSTVGSASHRPLPVDQLEAPRRSGMRGPFKFAMIVGACLVLGTSLLLVAVAGIAMLASGKGKSTPTVKENPFK